MEHTKHIFRALLIPLFLAMVFLVVRPFVVPASFGEHGPYRYDDVAEQRAKEPVHGAAGACAGCHQEQQDERGQGKHAVVSCEVCHAPLAVHARGGEKRGDMPVDRSDELCLRCHWKLEARPQVVPQVIPEEHDEEGDGCLECHMPHNPEP